MAVIRIEDNPIDKNKDGKITLDELISSVFWIVTWIVLAVNVGNLAFLGALYILKPWDGFRGALAWSVIVFCASFAGAITYGASIAHHRMKRYERMEAEAMKDKAHERAVAAFEFDVLQGKKQKEEDTRGDTGTQEHYARLFLQMSYKQGKFITRREWTEKGLSEDWWNRINGLLQDFKIRKGGSSKLQHDGFAEAWGAWCDAIMNTRHWTKAGDDLLPG